MIVTKVNKEIGRYDATYTVLIDYVRSANIGSILTLAENLSLERVMVLVMVLSETFFQRTLNGVKKS